MISKLICRNAAQITLAFFLAISFTASAQTVTTLTNLRAGDLLKTADAGTLRAHMVDQLKAKIMDQAVGERFTAGARSITCELVSQNVMIGRDKVEQISLVYIESGVTRTLDFVQYANGDFGKLEGNKLVTYSLSSNRQECLNALFGAGSDCAACKTKVLSCLNSSPRLYKQLSCLLRSIDGSCLRCGVDYYLVMGCILG